MKKFKLLCLSLLLGAFTSLNAEHIKNEVPIPSAAQLTWQDAELVAVFHYDLHVFDGKQYNQPKNHITPIEDYNIFNPQQLDTDQWIRSVKAMGAKIAIITATHETGFALYQSDVNPFCMKALRWKDGKGDIVRDFVNSCRKYGIKPGIYIGIRWNSFLGVHDFMMPNDGTQFQKNRQLAYNRMCEGMTEELMSRYGDLAIVWYDGGAHGPELGGADILPIVEKYQKNILFYHNSQRADMRWGGTETGTVNYPCWGNYPTKTTRVKKPNKPNRAGDPNGSYYIPAMSDAPLRGYNGRHEWFWEPGDEAHIFPLDNLMHMYLGSVGRNTSLILGITPDDRGLIPDADVQRMKEFGEEINRRYATPIASVKGDKKNMTLKLDKAQRINAINLCEDIRFGERVRQYTVEGKVNGKWQKLSEGTCIGHRRLVEIEPVEVSSLRLRIQEVAGKPSISEFSVYAY